MRSQKRDSRTNDKGITFDRRYVKGYTKHSRSGMQR